MTDFDHTYFDTLYGRSPRQSWADRSRDRLVERLVRTYAPPLGGTHAANGTTADLSSRNSLLDIGCGYGFLLERFAPDYRLFGVDISEHAVAVARRRLPEAALAVADIQLGLPFPSPFRAVLLINVLEHLPHPAEATRILHDAIAPDGLCVVHLPTINNACNRLYYRHSYAKDETHVFRPSGDEVTRLFEAAGFETIMESYAPHTPGWLWRRLKPFPPFLGAYRRR